MIHNGAKTSRYGERPQFQDVRSGEADQCTDATKIQNQGPIIFVDPLLKAFVEFTTFFLMTKCLGGNFDHGR